MPEALALVRRELGPDAAVLHTRKVRGLKRWLSGGRIEVMASTGVNVPNRLAATQRAPATAAAAYSSAATSVAASVPVAPAAAANWLCTAGLPGEVPRGCGVDEAG